MSEIRIGGELARQPIKNDNKLFVVGLGASAGGLESLEQFFSHMPSDAGLAYIVVTHLDPTHKSILSELIGRFTAMPVSEAKNKTLVEANNVYVLPPNKDISIFHGAIQLFEPHEPRGLRHPIDFFFRSLAEDVGDRAIGIVLSGTGSEGSLGLKAIKEKAGVAMAEDPKTAKYDGMPSNAIATGLVDFILQAAELPDAIVNYVKRFPSEIKVADAKTPKTQRDALEKVYALIRDRTGHDFSGYKSATVLRRIQRRMALLQLDNLNDYIKFLRMNPSEIDDLFRELLIRVTNFFRDPDAFEVLKKKVLPDIFKGRETEYPVRIWVPGCATGEEAYSLAIAVHEFMDSVKGAYRVQIFASDIDDEAIGYARRGVYPDNISADVSDARLNRFFVKMRDAYKVKDEIRESIIFATQNVVKDPPFSRLDLISCRNVMIYLKPEMQEKLFSTFYYSLRPRGFLFLGNSETVGKASDLFSILDKKWKIFKATSIELSPIHGEHSVSRASRKDIVHTQTAGYLQSEASLGELAKGILLNRYSPAAILLNNKGDILYFYGRTSRYLEPPSGMASLNIKDMAREGLLYDLQTAINLALKEKRDVALEGMLIMTGDESVTTSVTVQYIKRPARLRGLLLVVFTDTADSLVEPSSPRAPISESSADLIEELKAEIKVTRERLQTTIEDFEATNEELKSANEEQQSSNEELQSANEELETSKEELQATNEELMLVNAELQHNVDDLYIANSDISNLITATNIATVFLDNNLHVRRFTPQASNLISLIESDKGRPFSDITLKLEYPDLQDDIRKVSDSLIPSDKEVQDKDGVWYSVRILPYRSIQGQIDGVVVMFIDIVSLKELQSGQDDALGLARGVIDSVTDPLVVLDAELRILFANLAFLSEFSLTEREAFNQSIADVGNGALAAPALQKYLHIVLTKRKSFANYEVEFDLKETGHRKFLVSGKRIPQKGRQTAVIILSMKAVP